MKRQWFVTASCWSVLPSQERPNATRSSATRSPPSRESVLQEGCSLSKSTPSYSIPSPSPWDSYMESLMLLLMNGKNYQVSCMRHTQAITILYSRKIWWGIKLGGLAVYITTVKLKFAKISYSHIYVWRSHTEPPNLNLLIFLQ